MIDLKTTFEITAGIVRFLSPDAADPFAFDAAVAIIGDEGAATIKALTVPPGGYTEAHRIALEAALRQAGFHTAIWRRRKLRDGQSVVISRRQDLTTTSRVPSKHMRDARRARRLYESRGLLSRSSTNRAWTLGM